MKSGHALKCPAVNPDLGSSSSNLAEVVCGTRLAACM